jgi:hypothetical protein
VDFVKAVLSGHFACEPAQQPLYFFSTRAHAESVPCSQSESPQHLRAQRDRETEISTYRPLNGFPRCLKELRTGNQLKKQHRHTFMSALLGQPTK